MATAQSELRGHEESRHWSALIARMARGDQGAVGELYDASSRMVYGLVLRIVGDSAAAEEITLDVYTQAWRISSAYSAERGAPTSWLMLLARSRAIDYLRSRARRSQEREQSLEDAAAVHHPSANPEASAMDSARRATVQAALSKLLPEQRQALELAYYKGMSHSEIAASTGQPLGTIKTRIRLGMLRLRDLLQPYAEGI